MLIGNSCRVGHERSVSSYEPSVVGQRCYSLP